MTNAEINQEAAVENLQAGKLNSYQAEFVRKIRDYSKNELKNLTSKQYALLVECADK